MQHPKFQMTYPPIFRRGYSAIAIVALASVLLSGCGRKERLVGESNGWTLEDYKKAVAEGNAESESPAK